MSLVTVSSPRHRAAPARGQAPRFSRRVSGPARGSARSHPAPQPGGTLAVRALAIVRSLPNRSLIDRLVRGRAWIPVLGVLLAGIVAMQVEILKLGTSIGRSLERTAALQSRNGALQASVASLSDDQRIERLAQGMGMLMPSPSSLTFLTGQGQNRFGRALNGIHAPDPATFAAQVAAQLAAAAAVAPGTTTASPAVGSAAASPGTASSAPSQTSTPTGG